jgi:plastocyanin
MKTYLFIAVLLTVASMIQAQEAAPKFAPLNIGGIDNKTGGTITGVVRFRGAKPEAKPVTDIAGNAFCKQCYKGDLPKHDDFVFGKNGSDDTLVNVLVYVSKGLEGKKFEPTREPALLDQVGCMYTPHVVAVMVGQTLKIRNSDATLHNVMASPWTNPQFNTGTVKDQVIEKVFRQPELKINTKCFMHPWMSAYIHVLDNPFFAVTQTDGTFTLKGLPPGEYEISVLHETSLFEPTPATATVKIAGNETKKIDFTYQPKAQ